MSKLGTLSEQNNRVDSLWYKVLSFIGGQDLQKTERQKLREARKQAVESAKGNSWPQENELKVIIQAALSEASLIDDFNPDLLIMSEEQYREMFDIGVNEDMDVPEFAPMQGVKYSHNPPRELTFEEHSIDATYSQSSDGMLLVESGSL